MLKNFLKNTKIEKRLLTSFATLIAFVVLLIINSIVALEYSEHNLEKIVEINNKKVDLASEIKSNVNLLYINIAQLNAAETKKEAEIYKEGLKQSRTNYQASLKELKNLETSKAGKEILDNFLSAMTKAVPVNNKAVKLAVSKKRTLFHNIYITEVIPTRENLNIAIEKLVDYEHEKTNQNYESAKFGFKVALSISILLGLLVITISIFLSKVISKSIINPLNDVVAIVTPMAEGDFSTEIPEGLLSRHDEMGGVAVCLGDTFTSLKDMLGRVRDGVQSLASASTELSAISTQMTSSNSQTLEKSNTVAAAAEEMSLNSKSVANTMDSADEKLSSVAAATEEMTSTISEIAQHSDSARNITTEAVDYTKEVIEAVKELEKSAFDIGEVTEAITGISSQTNLLALNATIEATRAGAAGKGFAVVANEIKELAHQTAMATEDIKGKISSVQDSSTKAIGDINKISDIIQNVSMSVSSIAAAIEQQSSVINDVSKNIVDTSNNVKEANTQSSEASTVSESIAKEIALVSEASGELAQSGQQINTSVDELAELAEGLRALSDCFRT